MKNLIFSGLIFVASLSALGHPSVESRVNQLLDAMTLDEKLSLISGTQFDVKGLPRLGIPDLKMTDGPIGVRWEKATAFPSGISMASTFDPVLEGQIATAIGEEALAKGRNMVLGPTVGILRSPRGGRNFESFGEDPYLSSRMAEAYVQGLQSQKVLACVKHFALNDQEIHRKFIDSRIDERSLHEIHLPAFLAAIKAGVGSVMASYNRINGSYATENSYLLKDILKIRWGFKGFVVSDWWALHSFQRAFYAGTDLEMPHGVFFGPTLKLALHAGLVPTSILDDKVRRILRSMLEVGLFDQPPMPKGFLSDDMLKRHRDLALRGAQNSIVLLKNEKSVLPLKIASLHRVAVIGPNAATYVAGGGSSLVDPVATVTPLQGIKDIFGPQTQIEFSTGEDLPKAVSLARNAEVALLFVGFNQNLEGETRDRQSLILPGNQNQLVAEISKVQKQTIVVINSGGPVLMGSWIQNVPAILQAWYPGQEGGTAIVDVLVGKINPSAKLPATFMKKEEDSSDFGHYPGRALRVDYAEGLYVGYRHFDKMNIEPQFPFGHGLSYTSFEYRNLEISQEDTSALSPVMHVSLEVKNSGKVNGAEVVELYVQSHSKTVDRPFQELKGFKKVTLAPGETRQVLFNLDRSSFAYYDKNSSHWKIEGGIYKLRIGSSSRDIKLVGEIQLK